MSGLDLEGEVSASEEEEEAVLVAMLEPAQTPLMK